MEAGWNCMDGLMIMFSIFAGISIWKRRPNAIKTTKIYFVFAGIYTLFRIIWFGIFSASLITAAAKAGLAKYQMTQLLTLVGFVILFLYLTYSVRVKQIFPEPALPKTVSPPTAADLHIDR